MEIINKMFEFDTEFYLYVFYVISVIILISIKFSESRKSNIEEDIYRLNKDIDKNKDKIEVTGEAAEINNDLNFKFRKIYKIPLTGISIETETEFVEIKDENKSKIQSEVAEIDKKSDFKSGKIYKIPFTDISIEIEKNECAASAVNHEKIIKNELTKSEKEFNLNIDKLSNLNKIIEIKKFISIITMNAFAFVAMIHYYTNNQELFSIFAIAGFSLSILSFLKILSMIKAFFKMRQKNLKSSM